MFFALLRLGRDITKHGSQDILIRPQLHFPPPLVKSQRSNLVFLNFNLPSLPLDFQLTVMGRIDVADRSVSDSGNVFVQLRYLGACNDEFFARLLWHRGLSRLGLLGASSGLWVLPLGKCYILPFG